MVLSRPVYVVAIVLVLLGGILVRFNYLNVEDFRGGADEGFYVKYGAYMAKEDGASIRALSEEYIRNKDWQQFPNPLRPGHILLSAWWMQSIDQYDFQALAYLSFIFSALLLFLGYLFTRRLFDRDVALLALILLAGSPLALAMGRRALQDSVVSFFMILTVYLFYEAFRSKRLWQVAAFSLSFYVAVMVKETSILLAAFFVAYLLYERLFVRKDAPLLPLSIGLGASLTALAVSYLMVTGGAAQFMQIVKIIILSPSTNEYATRYQTGPLYRYLYDFFLVSPLPCIAAVGFCVYAVVAKRWEEGGIRYLAAFFIIMYILFSFFSKNLRYVMALDVPIRIFAALGVWMLCARLGRYRMAAAGAVTLVLAVIDVQLFRHIFLVCGVYDPVTEMLLGAWRRM